MTLNRYLDNNGRTGLLTSQMTPAQKRTAEIAAALLEMAGGEAEKPPAAPTLAERKAAALAAYLEENS